jgi:hypothetical protein
MKVSVALFLTIPALAAAFTRPTFGCRSQTALHVVTGPKGKPAKTKEEDLELTREVIAEYMGGDAPDSEPEAPAPAAAPKEEE